MDVSWERVKAALDYKKPAFWVIAAAVIACAAAAVCFLTAPAEEQDPSPLNYENPVSLEGQPEAAAQEESAPAYTWVDHYGEDTAWEAEKLTLTLPEFPDVMFTYTPGEIRIAGMSGVNKLAYSMPGMPVWNAYFADLTGDGVPELCATVSFGSGMVDEHIEVFDAATWEHYALWNRGEYDYALSADGGVLTVRRRPYHGWSDMETGTLRFIDGHLTFVRFENPRSSDFTDIMGFDGYRRLEELVPQHYLQTYIANVNGEARKIAESFGFEADDHIVDLDGDGVTELVCNCVYGGDLVARIYVYRRNGNTIERGSIDYDKVNMTAWENRGMASTAERYDPASGRMLVEYASLASSSGDGTSIGTFTVEAGYDALVWEKYAELGAAEQRT